MIKLFFCQNDSPMGVTFWQKDSLITHIHFKLCLIMIFSQVANFAQQSLFTSPGSFSPRKKSGLYKFERFVKTVKSKKNSLRTGLKPSKPFSIMVEMKVFNFWSLCDCLPGHLSMTNIEKMEVDVLRLTLCSSILRILFSSIFSLCYVQYYVLKSKLRT